MKESLYFQSILLFLFIFSQFAGSEEVNKFLYDGRPEELRNKKLALPHGTVAMSEYVPVYDPFRGKASIILAIDNADREMIEFGADNAGYRFKVPFTVLDSLYAIDPKCEVGLCVWGENLWFDQKDCPLFKTLSNPKVKGAYLPYVTLDSVYKEVDNMTGIRILKKYLTVDTATGIQPRVKLKYTSPYKQDGINIKVGFDAIREGCTYAKNPREHQFVIFLAGSHIDLDSVAVPAITKPPMVKDIPTTFVGIYLCPICTPDQIAEHMANINKMANNIKTNGYSIYNPLSNLWSTKTDFLPMVKFFMDKAFPLIKTISNIYLRPKTISINTVSPASGWDGKGFTFQKPFPLTGMETPFHYIINYQLVKDSITPTDTVHIVLRDTVHEFTFTVNLQDNAPVPAPVKLLKWNRMLSYCCNGVEITSLLASMKDVEVRFTEKKVDVLYGYKNVGITATHTGGQPADVENFKLKEQTGHHTVTFSQVTGSPNPGNGILEHPQGGEICALFRNPELPLDTLRKAVPFHTPFLFNNGIYFDNNADGHADSIFIGVTMDAVNPGLLEKLREVISSRLPQHRSFTVQSCKASPFGIGLTVREGAADIGTFVTGDDKLVVSDTVFLVNDVKLFPCTVHFIDSMAPVVLKCTYIEKITIEGADTVKPFVRRLTVVLSEEVRAINDPRPFRYFNPGANQGFNAVLDVKDQQNAVAQCEVKSFEGRETILQGDSICVNWDIKNGISDALNNVQDNLNNIRRGILVAREVIKKPKPYDVLLKMTLLNPDSVMLVPNQFLDLPRIRQVIDRLPANQKKQVANGVECRGIALIVIEPDKKANLLPADSCDATFSIFDATGNRLLSNQPMDCYVRAGVFNRLIYIWNGSTARGRIVGEGAYVVFAQVRFHSEKKTYKSKILKGMMGVKR